MKEQLASSFKQVISDRPLAASLLVLFTLVIGYVVYVLVAISPSELQVVVRYTSYGITNFYRDQWYYLFNFVGFGLLTLAVVPMLVVKLLRLDYRQYALLLVWLSVLIVVVAWVTAQSVLRLAALS